MILGFNVFYPMIRSVRYKINFVTKYYIKKRIAENKKIRLPVEVFFTSTITFCEGEEHLRQLKFFPKLYSHLTLYSLHHLQKKFKHLLQFR